MQSIRHALKPAAAAILLALAAPIAAAPAMAEGQQMTQQQAPQLPRVQSAYPGITGPTEKYVVALSDFTMRRFVSSLGERNMLKFWQHVSPKLQQSASVEKMNEVFKNFFDGISGDPLQAKSPIFSRAPVVNEQGNLVVSGFYATAPKRLSFDLVYGLEGRAWKLLNINVNVASQPPATPVQGRRPPPGTSRGQSIGNGV